MAGEWWTPGDVGLRLVLAVLLFLSYVDERVQPTVYRSLVVLADLARAEAVETRCRRILEERKILVLDMALSLSLPHNREETTFRVRTRDPLQNSEVLRELAKLDGIIEARWG